MGKAPAVQTADAFFALLQKSRLLSEEQLAEVKEATAGQEDPRAIARFLLKKELLTRWQATQLLAGFHALIIGKYKLCDAIGRGELGRVFLAQHGQLGRRVALKTLPRQHTQQARVLERFLAEARKIADLDHRNLIHVYDIDDEDGRYFLVTEYAEGTDLQSLVDNEGALPFERVVELTKQAADGLAFLHERGLTHQDLKPANLVLNNDGVVKLLDVGIGQLRSAVLGEQVGSSAEVDVGPRYLSPEQLGGHPADERSDVFSLGCIMYWLLTGAPPYPRATSSFGSVQPLNEIRPDAPPELVELCEAMMQLQPAERKLSAGDCAARLGELRSDASDEAPVSANVTESKAADTQTIDADTKTMDTAELSGLPNVVQDNGPEAFSISTKKRRGAKGGKKKKKAAPAVADSGEAAATPANSNKKLFLILGAGAAGVVIVIAVLAFIFMQSGKGSVANADEGQPEATDSDANAETPPADPGDPEIGDPEIGDPEIGDPEIGDPEVDNPPAENLAAGDANPAGEGPTEPISAAGANADAPKKAGVAEAPANGAAAKPMDKPADNAVAKPNDPPAKPKDTKPKNEAKPKNDKPKTPNVAKTETNKKDPLAGIPKMTQLPPLFTEKGEPHPDAFKRKALGTIVLADKVLCSIYMRGGDGAVRGRKVFSIRNANGGLAEREWEIRLEGSEIGGENIVANLKIEDDNKLYFQWSKDAVKDPSSAHLINCMLNVNLTVGGATKDLALRRPVAVDPLTIDMDRAGTKVRWEIPTPPNPDKVFIAVAGLAPPFPKSVMEPDKPVPAERSTILVRVGEKEADQVLVFKIDATMKRNVEVNVTAWAQFSKAAKMERINKASLKKMADAASGGAQQATIAVNRLAQMKPGNDKNLKQKLERDKNLANQAMAYWTEMNGKVEKLKSLNESLNGQGKIKFRMYYQTEAGEVTLLRSK